jgi:hypothetical protein
MLTGILDKVYTVNKMINFPIVFLLATTIYIEYEILLLNIKLLHISHFFSTFQLILVIIFEIGHFDNTAEDTISVDSNDAKDTTE